MGRDARGRKTRRFPSGSLKRTRCYEGIRGSKVKFRGEDLEQNGKREKRRVSPSVRSSLTPSRQVPRSDGSSFTDSSPAFLEKVLPPNSLLPSPSTRASLSSPSKRSSLLLLGRFPPPLLDPNSSTRSTSFPFPFEPACFPILSLSQANRSQPCEGGRRGADAPVDVGVEVLIAEGFRKSFGGMG